MTFCTWAISSSVITKEAVRNLWVMRAFSSSRRRANAFAKSAFMCAAPFLSTRRPLVREARPQCGAQSHVRILSHPLHPRLGHRGRGDAVEGAVNLGYVEIRSQIYQWIEPSRFGINLSLPIGV